jgi:hypothetical protein
MTRKSGRCPKCPYTIRLRKDGTVMGHLLYMWRGRIRCEGSGLLPAAERVKDAQN